MRDRTFLDSKPLSTKTPILCLEELLDDVLNIKGNHEIEKIKALEERIELYRKAESDNERLNYISFLLQSLSDEREFNRTPARCQIQHFVFDRLTTVHSLDLMDVRLSARASLDWGYTSAHAWAMKLLKNLENFKEDKRYISIKGSIHTNATLGLIRGKSGPFLMKKDQEANPHLYDGMVMYPWEVLTAMFNIHYSTLMEICGDKGGYYKVAKATVTVRKGILFDDDNLIEEGLSILREAGKHVIVEMLQKEVEDYKEVEDL